MRRWLALLTLLALSACAGVPPGPPPPSPQEVVELSRQNVDPGQIIRRMQESGAVYRLSAAELARLRELGVADAVINYMQNTYLEAVRQEADRFHPYAMWPHGLGFYPPHGFWWPYRPGWPYGAGW